MSKLYYSREGSTIHKETEYDELTLNFDSIECDYNSDVSDPSDYFITEAYWSDNTPLSEDELIQLEKLAPDILERAAENNSYSYADYLYDQWKANRE